MARVLNKDAVAAKQHAEERRGDTDDKVAANTRKVAIVNDRTIINGHVLPAGCVVALTEEDIVNHRRHGVALDDVRSEDEREVFDVSKAAIAKGSADGDED